MARWRLSHCGGALGRRAQVRLTALMHAGYNGRADCARLLLAAGADTNAKDVVRARAGVACGALENKCCF